MTIDPEEMLKKVDERLKQAAREALSEGNEDVINKRTKDIGKMLKRGI